MPKLWETLPPVERLALSVRAKSPARLALTFAAFVGVFYDRSEFDDLARLASDLYTTESEASASCFRARLDRRLYDRYHAPVAWDIAPAETSRTR